jgi:mono/diheme cytochrome c family protein
MKIGNQACVVIAVLSLQALPANAADEVAKGRELAQRLCATCHMAPGQGEKKSRAEIPGFYAIARRPNQDEEGIIAWLRTVPPMMPNHHLSQDEMVSLAQFIMSLRDGQQP